MAPTFRWEKQTQRYRYTSGDRSGQFVGWQTLHDLTGDYQSQQREVGQSITDKLIKGDITTAEWLREQSAQLKQGHITMYGLAAGGMRSVNQSDYGFIGSRLRSEYGYLRNFAQIIEDGKLSEAQIRARINLYYDNLWRTYESGRERSHKAEGYQWERRFTRPGDVCPDCVGYAAQGWVKIGTLPAPGDESVCRANCRCYKEFNEGATRPQNSLLNHSFGWIGTTMITTPSSTATLNLDEAVAIAQKCNPNVSRQDVEDIVAQMGDNEDNAPGPGVTASPLQQDTEMKGFYWGNPNAEDLEIIQQMTGFDWAPEYWFMASMRASDNLMWGDEPIAWHGTVLEEMTRQYPGQSLMIDHNAWEIKNTKGFFTRSALVSSDNAPQAILDSQGYGEENRDRVSQVGWIQVYLQAAIPATETELIHALKTRQIEDVSTGSILSDRAYFCPHCSKAEGRDVNFYETRKNAKGEEEYVCPHSVPTYWNRLFASWFGEEVNFADYAVLAAADGQRHYETSFVGVGNLASAEVLRPAR